MVGTGAAGRSGSVGRRQRDEGESNGGRLGERLRSLRRSQRLTLQGLAERSGIAVSTLSKVENNRMSLAYDNLMRLASGLGVEIGALFQEGSTTLPPGRRAITRRGEGVVHETDRYRYEMLCTDMTPKRMNPMVARLKARTMVEFGDPLRHSGEEFIHVLEGSVEVHLDGYRPVRLEVGDSLYIDSPLGHAYLATGEGPAVILGVPSHAPEFREATVRRGTGNDGSVPGKLGSGNVAEGRPLR
jgi:transcriptional regulator with XRE-family HTH domain